MQLKRVFSGIQPTGDIHLGNYLGAVKNWVDREKEYDNVFCVVNSHAITIPQDPKVLREKTYELCAMLLACGLKDSTLFIQSEVQEHTSLGWLLTCITPMGDLNRMTQFKDKSQKNPKNILAGLFNYPNLMSADILLYKSHYVPVGEDQKQHIELARDTAIRFNRDFGETFIVPEPLIQKEGARIMGLDDPTKKMSKSSGVDKPNHLIALLDTPEVILKKCKKATTDSENKILFDKDRAGIYNLLTIYQCLSGDSKENIESEFANKGYGEFKVALADLIIEKLKPIRESYLKLIDDKSHLESILKSGANKAREIAEKTYKEAKEKMGLI
ncbi:MULTISPECIES: tryptophan--tRNA ligase [Helicobacter]|uniref:Tryptophan--tRNA ligase n=1 Tax=Helicobacter ibis TaxID=2962633 RepID=A0ABT4VBN6_9HELI|nr:MULTISPECIES: tryptophan--tRNA ligase [Helicobacter]MDA3966888.1 tryptophan--tRNA ligase [Helicobacter sp. WB40]MDA3968115.1 tryptophan--tRNA ligase [Helicobacter ibis]